MVAMPTPWKHPKTGVYWFRRAIPAELRGMLTPDGKRIGWEIKFTLGTKEAKAAKDAFGRESERVNGSGGSVANANPLKTHHL